MLTPKQEQFCKYIVSGFSNKQSYLKAYNGSNEQVAYNESTKLLKREDIQERIKALNKPLDEQFNANIATYRQEQIEFIKSRISICKEKGDETSLIKWSDQLNKIYGIYKEIDQDRAVSNPLDTLDTETLQNMIKAV